MDNFKKDLVKDGISSSDLNTEELLKEKKARCKDMINKLKSLCKSKQLDFDALYKEYVNSTTNINDVSDLESIQSLVSELTTIYSVITRGDK